MSAAVPKVFISYSHDSQEHKKWVLELAQRLRNSGVDAILDQFRLGLGDDLGSFMEQGVVTSDRIIMVCTETYVGKANDGLGGVGYEKMIMTADYMNKIETKKVIPLIRQKGSNDVPAFLKSRLHINFSRDDEFELQFDNLLREIHEAPLFKEPEVGNNPFQSIESKPAESITDKKTELLKEWIKKYNEGHGFLMFDEIQRKLSSSKIFAEYYIKQLIEEGYIVNDSFFIPHRDTLYGYSLTDKAKIHAIHQGWVTE
ncbi:toll/interleukin-1 receptor domain-containing protein [Vibrio campbellii]|uniref:toll/interleukin-1 receptor domain-containing protein n=1 Tax=Vibrio campbellii TaxID=680 RepID=UPI003D6A592F